MMATDFRTETIGLYMSERCRCTNTAPAVYRKAEKSYAKFSKWHEKRKMRGSK